MTSEQRRALMALEHVATVVAAEDRKQYASMAHKLPALVRSAGLCQALHFVRTRKKPALERFLDHIALQAGRVVPGIADGEALCVRARTAELGTYLVLTREVLASATWYSRLAESEWGIKRDAELQEA